MTRTTDIVVTTIFEPAWLSGYLDDIAANGRIDDVTIRIIGDRKTPGSVWEAADEGRRRGFRIDCPDLEAQEAYLRSLGLTDLIPWNTDNRRNIGFLRAWESSADVLISIDDDNYCRPGGDFVGSHQIVGSRAGDVVGQGADGGAWFNICSLLDIEPSARIYPRGFPYAARHSGEEASATAAYRGDPEAVVALNAGLWLDDPDADAITRLALAPNVKAASATAVLIGGPTWTPINTQNTALVRQAIPAYYYVRMGYALQGLKIDRFGDILSGYFVQACAKELGHVVRVGSPAVDHRRTPHDLLKDLHHELAGIILIENLLPWLQEVSLSGSSYRELYGDLAERLLEASGTFSGTIWDEGGRDFLVETARCMQTWLGAIDRIDAA